MTTQRAPADELPDPLDDAAILEAATTAPPAERERAEQDDGPPRVAPIIQGEFDDIRSRIAARYKELRDSEEAEYADAQAEHARINPDPGEHQHHQPQPQYPQSIEIVVDGQRQVLPVSEVIRRAQINSAADNRLEEAKRILSEAKQARRDYRGDDDEYEEPRHHSPTPNNPSSSYTDKLGSIVERIQVGDKDEGTQALTEAVPLIAAQVQHQMVVNATEREMQHAVNEFERHYGDVVRDQDLGEAGLSVLRRTLVDRLKSVGIHDADMLGGKVPRAQEVRILAHAAAAARREGRDIPDFNGILSEVGRTLETKFHGVRRSPDGGSSRRAGGYRIASDAELAARNDRKRTMMGQPRPAGIRADYNADRGQRPQTAQEIVQAARRARGFDR